MKYLEIIKDDLVYNILKLKEHCAPAKIIAVLKGNAYGIGMIQFGHILIENGVDTFAVSELSEAVELRNAGFDNEIILLTPTESIDEAKEIADNNITATVASIRSAEVLNAVGLEVNAHIKIDTGFGRYGFYNDDLTDKLNSFENITYTGVFSHFSNSFGKSEDYSKEQFSRFERALEILKNMGIDPPTKHICNSCAAIRYDFARLDAVRIGSAFLGRLPIENTLGLKRIARLKCTVSEVRRLPKGSVVGYANTYRTKRETTAAVIPVGYKDGFGTEKSKDTFRFMDILRYMFADFKTFHKKIYVTISGRQFPLIGRISMHNIVVDVTGSDVRYGDVAQIECNPVLLKSEIQRLYI